MLPVNFFPEYGAATVALSRPNLSVLSPKVPQDLKLFLRMSRAVDETGFGFSRQDIYIPFSALVSAPTLLTASPRQGGLSSIFPDVTSTVGVCPMKFFIRRFYYALVNRLGNFHTLKHINSFFKRLGYY